MSAPPDNKWRTVASGDVSRVMAELDDTVERLKVLGLRPFAAVFGLDEFGKDGKVVATRMLDWYDRERGREWSEALQAVLDVVTDREETKACGGRTAFGPRERGEA